MSAVAVVTDDDLDDYFGVVVHAKPRHGFTYARHGNATRLHRPRSVEVWWRLGVLRQYRVVTACSSRLTSAVLSKWAHTGLQPCSVCFPCEHR